MKAQSIENKLMVLFTMGAVFTLTVVIISIYAAVTAIMEQSHLSEQRALLDNSLAQLNSDIRDSRLALLNMINEKDTVKRIEYRDRALAFTGNYRGKFDHMVDNDMIKKIPFVRSLLIDIKEKWELFSDTRDNSLIPLIMAGKEEEARKLAIDVQRARHEWITDQLKEVSAGVEAFFQIKDAEVKKKGVKVIIFLLLLMSVSFSVGAIVFYRYSRGLTSRITLLKEGAQRLSGGDLSSRMDIPGDDEIASLAVAFNRMAEWIQEDMDMMLKSERTLQEKNAELNEAMVEAQQHAKVMAFAAKERERQSKQLVEMQSQLLQSEKMASVGQLAAGVAHEINNPIGFVKGNLSSLAAYVKDIKALEEKYVNVGAVCHREGPDKAMELMKEVEHFREEKDMAFVFDDLGKLVNESMEGLNRVAIIVKDLKEFSHVDDAELMDVDINKGLESTINIAWNEIKYRAEVVKEFGDIPALHCYAHQLNQVFMNLIVNAAHAITAIQGKGRIGIKTYRQDGGVFIEISDNGCGIPEDKINRIFDPFFTTKPVGKGTGLGLSIAYSIIKKHKGEINVASRVGEGTTFTIKLPIEMSWEELAPERFAGAGV